MVGLEWVRLSIKSSQRGQKFDSFFRPGFSFSTKRLRKKGATKGSALPPDLVGALDKNWGHSRPTPFQILAATAISWATTTRPLSLNPGVHSPARAKGKSILAKDQKIFQSSSPLLTVLWEGKTLSLRTMAPRRKTRHPRHRRRSKKKLLGVPKPCTPGTEMPPAKSCVKGL
ncbi:hypothetical protein GWK47_020354 [Chionoecetes opilio]|uniref:Uncharacterized protein n=1 Tax=Chionoecetes opilio TaxID=41210 RepID=A0A8J4XPS3_CHIOP|nr:hypothetical protein GWK47_020354 [Chionoecetes opilio]